MTNVGFHYCCRNDNDNDNDKDNDFANYKESYNGIDSIYS